MIFEPDEDLGAVSCGTAAMGQAERSIVSDFYSSKQTCDTHKASDRPATAELG